jgi:hypothetical protein
MKIRSFVLVSGLALTAWATTQSKIAGIITAIEPQSLTICPIHGKSSVTGKLDPARTRVVVNGKPARAADLQVTFNAKAEIGLDDVWLSVNASR